MKHIHITEWAGLILSVQVIIEGIAIFSIILGRDFVHCGFMHSCLYLLLQNLISSNNQIRSASDAALRVVSAATGHSTVSKKL